MKYDLKICPSTSSGAGFENLLARQKGGKMGIRLSIY
jgi:hypothetical protein